MQQIEPTEIRRMPHREGDKNRRPEIHMEFSNRIVKGTGSHACIDPLTETVVGQREGQAEFQVVHKFFRKCDGGTDRAIRKLQLL